MMTLALKLLYEVDAHKTLFKELNSHPALPLPDQWLETESAERGKRRLQNLLKKKIADTETIWGFKDPRTASFLPIWNHVLNAPGIVPVFVLAVRDPASVCISLKNQINRPEAITELQWLTRITESLHHTAANCFIVHYEDWFTRAADLGRDLLRYTGLAKYFKGDIDGVLKDLIKPNLNRSRVDYADYTIQNPLVMKLYGNLKECRGQDFDHHLIMQTVKECRATMSGFKGWYLEAQSYIRDNQKLRMSRGAELNKAFAEQIAELNKTSAEKEKKYEAQQRVFEEDMHALTLQNSDHLRQIKELNDDIKEFKSEATEKIVALKSALDQEKKNKAKVDGRQREIEQDLKGLTFQNNAYLKQIKDQHDEIKHLSEKIWGGNGGQPVKQAAAKAERPKQNKPATSSHATRHHGTTELDMRQLKKLKREAMELRYSYSFRLGQILINAIIKPGLDTFLMPKYIVQLFWDIVTGRGRTKTEEMLKKSGLLQKQ